MAVHMWWGYLCTCIILQLFVAAAFADSSLSPTQFAALLRASGHHLRLEVGQGIKVVASSLFGNKNSTVVLSNGTILEGSGLASSYLDLTEYSARSQPALHVPTGEEQSSVILAGACCLPSTTFRTFHEPVIVLNLHSPQPAW